MNDKLGWISRRLFLPSCWACVKPKPARVARVRQCAFAKCGIVDGWQQPCASLFLNPVKNGKPAEDGRYRLPMAHAAQIEDRYGHRVRNARYRNNFSPHTQHPHLFITPGQAMMQLKLVPGTGDAACTLRHVTRDGDSARGTRLHAGRGVQMALMGNGA